MSGLLPSLYCRVSASFTHEDGQALTEYALIVALVALIAVVALELLGGGIKGFLLGAAPHS